MKTKNQSLKDLTHVALFAALLGIVSQFALPLPNGTPLSLQTFAVALAGYSLGSRKGATAVAVYLLLGGIGLPVFANFKAGLGALFGVTGGFLWGFLPLAFCAGLGRGRGLFGAFALGLVGLALCHGLGVLAFSLVSGNPLPASFAMASLPFLLKDALSLILAYLFAKTLADRRGQAF